LRERRPGNVLPDSTGGVSLSSAPKGSKEIQCYLIEQGINKKSGSDTCYGSIPAGTSSKTVVGGNESEEGDRARRACLLEEGTKTSFSEDWNLGSGCNNFCLGPRNLGTSRKVSKIQCRGGMLHPEKAPPPRTGRSKSKNYWTKRTLMSTWLLGRDRNLGPSQNEKRVLFSPLSYTEGSTRARSHIAQRSGLKLSQQKLMEIG